MDRKSRQFDQLRKMICLDHYLDLTLLHPTEIGLYQYHLCFFHNSGNNRFNRLIIIIHTFQRAQTYMQAFSFRRAA